MHGTMNIKKKNVPVLLVLCKIKKDFHCRRISAYLKHRMCRCDLKCAPVCRPERNTCAAVQVTHMLIMKGILAFKVRAAFRLKSDK